MTYEENTWEVHWDNMTPDERLRFVSLVFAEGEPYDTVWQTKERFEGYHLWWPMRWDDGC